MFFIIFLRYRLINHIKYGLIPDKISSKYNQSDRLNQSGNMRLKPIVFFALFVALFQLKGNGNWLLRAFPGQITFQHRFVQGTRFTAFTAKGQFHCGNPLFIIRK